MASRAPHETPDLFAKNLVGQADPELHEKRLEAGRKAAAFRDIKEKKSPAEGSTFHNAAEEVPSPKPFQQPKADWKPAPSQSNNQKSD